MPQLLNSAAGRRPPRSAERLFESQPEAMHRTASGSTLTNLTADEFVESEQYWRNRSAPKTKIIPLRNSASLRVQNGALELTERLPLHLAPDGEPHVVRFNADEARRGRIPQLAPSMPRAIILPEHGWHVTAEAVKFCLVHNIASASVAARTTQGEKGLVSIVAGNPIADAALLRAKQFGQTRRTSRGNRPTEDRDLRFARSLRRRTRTSFWKRFEGLFGGQEGVDLPKRAHRALDELGQMRALFEAVVVLAVDDARIDD